MRPNEIGSAEYIRSHAHRYKCRLFEYELDIQFRCGGSEAFVNWVNNTLGIQKTPNVLFTREHQREFDFQIFSSYVIRDVASLFSLRSDQPRPTWIRDVGNYGNCLHTACQRTVARPPRRDAADTA